MWSPTTIGLDAPGPGSSTFQAMFSDWDHLRGRFLASVTPWWVGPVGVGLTVGEADQEQGQQYQSEQGFIHGGLDLERVGTEISPATCRPPGQMGVRHCCISALERANFS